ncbi:MAG: TrmJ/YjtD family RNA methyltransferase [Sphingopyxis sp.]
MSFFAYILQCSDGSFYTGHTDALELRIAQHQSGECGGYCASRLPVELLWSEAFPTRLEALEAERQIKGWSRAKKEALIAGDWAVIALLGKKDFSARKTLPYAASTSSASTQDERGGKNAVGHTNPFALSSPLSPEPAEGQASVSKENSANKSPSAQPPVIILVRPQLGENIGKAARAMLNFGLGELRLVAPRDGWPNPSAGPAASGADVVLANAQIFDTLAEAVADCTQIIATTVRRRGLIKPVVGPDGAADLIRSEPGRTALLFGPERSGLDTDDAAIASAIMTVPINPEFGSLNLAQAVIIAAYEWSKRENLAQPSVVDLAPPAPQQELDGLIDTVNSMLDEADYFRPPERRQVTMRALRTLFTKPRWSAKEVQMMRGVLRAIKTPRRPS